ncbi:MAG: peptidase domain-containing ABC transporter [Bacteroidales bacterium]|nr:peptidase domain-containing ABC transporter [Bacteroidales bacterium]
MAFHFYHQHDAMDCGPACLRMIARFYGKTYSLERFRELTAANRNGVTLLGISDAAEDIGFRTTAFKIGFDKLAEKIVLPCIVHWRHDHFVVVYKIKVKKKKDVYTGTVYVADPAFGLIKYTVNEFLDGWISTRENNVDKGMVLMVAPSIRFYQEEKQDKNEKKAKLSWFFSYLIPYKKLLFQIILGILFGMLLQLIFPFLTQSLVDVGIANNNLNFIILILVAQMILAFSQMIVGFIQNWLSFHVNTRINIALISDFFIKLLKLPISFFDSKKTGDIMQRIGDHTRIEQFLTSTSINMIFSFVSFFVFAGILAYYNTLILVIFIIGHTLYILWITVFLRIRRKLDFKRFEKGARNQSNIVQLITGVQDIKMNNYDKKMRWKWEAIQAELFEVSREGITISQIQSAGGFFISQTTNIILTIIAAKSVVEGQMTLGMMMSLTYIIGQLKGPVSNLISFIHSYQDAKMSLERLADIHLKEDEDEKAVTQIAKLPSTNHTISLEKVSFRYLSASTPPVLEDITLTIPENKITAIVGSSGSGKTTLLKLILGNYKPSQGKIKIGNILLDNLDVRYWRSKCGIVMQDGYIFSETIAENIAVTSDTIDKDRLYKAAQTANITEFIEELPATYNTMIGQEGSGISQGEKQRVLIARSVYKNPDFLFFDEATNSLDANNESIIMKNLNEFFKGRTVIIVAHRLSTVRHADQIVVLNKGKISEIGTHEELIELKSEYYNLIKNQLELSK